MNKIILKDFEIGNNRFILNKYNYYDLTAFVKENNIINFIISFIYNKAVNFYHYQKSLTDNKNMEQAVKKEFVNNNGHRRNDNYIFSTRE